jgi:hypothetical protein
MFGTKTNQVFTSRWKALSWSLGVMATAYCTVPAAETDAQRAENEAAAKILAQQQQVQTPGVDPWANSAPNAAPQTATQSETDAAMEKVKVLEKQFGF